MIYSLRGKLIYTASTHCVIECGGVGFKVSVSMLTQKKLSKIGEEAFLYTHMHIREDAMELYGFSDTEEMSCFKMLISVSGVGPKVALSIMSELQPSQFAMCVVTDDVVPLTMASGVGPKLAKRIVLELKDKMKSEQISSDVSFDAGSQLSGDKLSEAANALIVLGYSKAEAVLAVGREDSSKPLEEIVRAALKKLMR